MDPMTSLMIITFASLVGAIGQTIIYLKTVSPEKLKTLQGEVRDYFSQLEAAKKSSDKKLLKQLEKKKKYMDSLQGELSSATMKQSLLSMVFALLIFYGLYSFFKPGQEVAFLSTYFLTPDGIQTLDFILWYALSSLFFSLLVRKIMRVS